MEENIDYLGRLSLQGRGLVVFGAGQGIGLETAVALRSAGARVVCVDMDPERAAAAAAKVGGEALVCNVVEPGAPAEAMRQAQALLGSVHGVVDIVGLSRPHWIADGTDEGAAEDMVINLTHCIALTRAAAPMIGAAGGGAISFVGSVAGLGVMARLSTYGAAKAGLHHFIKSAAFELGPQGVRVNAVSPGYVQTPRMLERLSAEGWQDITDATPLRRAGRPSDIASSVLFLSSDLGGFVTGQNLVTDGGVTLAYRVLRAPPGV